MLTLYFAMMQCRVDQLWYFIHCVYRISVDMNQAGGKR